MPPGHAVPAAFAADGRSYPEPAPMPPGHAPTAGFAADGRSYPEPAPMPPGHAVPAAFAADGRSYPEPGLIPPGHALPAAFAAEGRSYPEPAPMPPGHAVPAAFAAGGRSYRVPGLNETGRRADSLLAMCPLHLLPNPVPTRGFMLLPVVLAIAVVAAVALVLNREGAIAVHTAAGEREPETARLVAEAGLAHARWKAQAQGTCTGYGLPATPFGPHSYAASFSPIAGSPVTITATGTLAGGRSHTLTRAGIPLYEPPATLALQPGPEGKDGAVDAAQPDHNFGLAEFMLISGYGGADQRGLLEFDLSDIPAAQVVIAAELELFMGWASGATTAAGFSVRRMTEPWVEGTGAFWASGDGATWNTADGTEAWDWASNHAVAPVYARTHMNATAYGWHRFDVTELVAGWHAGTFPNHGLVIGGDALVQDAAFYTGDNAEHRPRLTVRYGCECGGNRHTVVVQPGAADGLDTYLNDGPQADGNYGGDGFITASTHSSLDRGLVRFALPPLPPAATLERAELTLNLVQIGSMNSGTASLHPLARSWLETQATWNEAAAGESWTAGGGDFDAEVATASIDDAAPGPRIFDVTATAAQWLQGTRPNFGFAVVAGPGINRANFASSDYYDAAKHPSLSVTWTCPCGTDCGPVSACDADFLANNTVSSVATTAYGSTSVQGLGWLPEGAAFAGATAPAGGAWLSLDADHTLSVAAPDGTLLGSCTLADPGSAGPTGVTWIASGTWAGHAAVAWDGPSTDFVSFVDAACSQTASFSTTGYGQHSPSGIAHIGATATGRHEGSLAVADLGTGSIFVVDQAGTLQATLDASAYVGNVRGLAHLPGTDRLLAANDNGEGVRLDFDGAHQGTYDAGALGADKPQAVAVDGAACRHAFGDPHAAVLVTVDASGVSGTTVTLAPAQDTFLGGAQATAYGTDASLFAGLDTTEWRPLLQFDLSAIPAGATLLSAKLRVHNWNDGSPGQGPVTLGAHRVLESWTATWAGSLGANWYGRAKEGGGESPWATPGGTHDPAAVASASFDAGASPQWVELDLEPLVQEWLDGVSPNHGVLLVPQAGSAFANLRSADFADPLLRPQLVIEYLEVAPL